MNHLSTDLLVLQLNIHCELKLYLFYIGFYFAFIKWKYSKVKVATLVEGDPKAPFSIATT